MTDWYDRDGQPMDISAADSRLGDPKYKRVALTRIFSAADPGIKYDVSTVWLGLDHGFGSDVPLIFETMVFGGDEDWADLLCQRYSTEEEAADGHAEIVATVAAAVPDEVVVDGEQDA